MFPQTNFQTPDGYILQKKNVEANKFYDFPSDKSLTYFRFFFELVSMLYKNTQTKIEFYSKLPSVYHFTPYNIKHIYFWRARKKWSTFPVRKHDKKNQ